jgi:glutamyl-tRNA reductase
LKFLAFQQADKEILDELMSNFYPEYNKTYSSRIIAQRRLSIQKRIKKYEDLLEKLPSDKRIQKELRKLYFDLEVIEE